MTNEIWTKYAINNTKGCVVDFENWKMKLHKQTSNNDDDHTCGYIWIFKLNVSLFLVNTKKKYFLCTTIITNTSWNFWKLAISVV